MDQILEFLMAQTPEVPAGQQPAMGQGCMQMAILIVPMFLIFYFLIIRPQQKQQKKHKEMLGALQKGDAVITNSGIFGTITKFTGQVATLEIAKNTHVRILRSHIAGIQPQGGEDADAEKVVESASK